MQLDYCSDKTEDRVQVADGAQILKNKDMENNLSKSTIEELLELLNGYTAKRQEITNALVELDSKINALQIVIPEDYKLQLGESVVADIGGAPDGYFLYNQTLKVYMIHRLMPSGSTNQRVAERLMQFEPNAFTDRKKAVHLAQIKTSELIRNGYIRVKEERGQVKVYELTDKVPDVFKPVKFTKLF
jgi:hypothetical protein